MDEVDTRDGTRLRILQAALELLTEGGPDAVSTRAVGAAAGVQAPTIYRLFGDKRGLLDALATHGLQAYLRQKSAQPDGEDPVQNLRTGWDLHVGFGLANPALYALMYGDPRPGPPSPAEAAGFAMLAGRIREIARAGRLKVGEERAAQLIHSAGRGTTLTLIESPPQSRDPGLADLAREAVIAAITTDTPAPTTPGPVAAAVALRAVLPDTAVLTDAEQRLLREWLDRIAAG